MTLNPRSSRTVVLILVICAFGAFLAGSSSSKEGAPVDDSAGIGRYQYVAVPDGPDLIFDTKIGLYWEAIEQPNVPTQWVPNVSAFGAIRKNNPVVKNPAKTLDATP